MIIRSTFLLLILVTYHELLREGERYRERKREREREREIERTRERERSEIGKRESPPRWMEADICENRAGLE